VSILIGSTGFVGGHLLKGHSFDQAVHRSNLGEIEGRKTDLLICAGLPAEKWKANLDPQSDWSNMSNLAQILSTVKSKKSILISTIDVYQPAINVDENDQPNLNGLGAYGQNRAWFEVFFKSHFPNSTVIRLPGLYATDLRKNLIFDLLNDKKDQLKNVNKKSKYQFFNVNDTWDVIQKCLNNNISLLNVSSAPVTAQEIASLFDVELGATLKEVNYNVQSIHYKDFHGKNGYLYAKTKILEEIKNLKAKVVN
jgi:nucleoside-diphosphate-sugar epimerase